MAQETSVGRGLGVNAGLDADLPRDLAERCAELGYHSLWANDEPNASGLETLSHFAVAAPHLDLGVGVIPLDRSGPKKIAADIERLSLDPAKLWLGIGSGQVANSLDMVRGGVAELRGLLPGARIVIAAMRTRLCHLGGEIADGVLLNWMLPAQAAWGQRWVQEGAEEAGVPPPATALYVRVAVGPGASQRLLDAEGHYRVITEGYRQHFEEMDVPLGSVGVAASDRASVQAGLEPYRAAIDLPIVRVLANTDGASLAAVAEAASPDH